jgi:hypothetical protein
MISTPCAAHPVALANRSGQKIHEKNIRRWGFRGSPTGSNRLPWCLVHPHLVLMTIRPARFILWRLGPKNVSSTLSYGPWNDVSWNFWSTHSDILSTPADLDCDIWSTEFLVHFSVQMSPFDWTFLTVYWVFSENWTKCHLCMKIYFFHLPSSSKTKKNQKLVVKDICKKCLNKDPF